MQNYNFGQCCEERDMVPFDLKLREGFRQFKMEWEAANKKRKWHAFSHSMCALLCIRADEIIGTVLGAGEAATVRLGKWP